MGSFSEKSETMSNKKPWRFFEIDGQLSIASRIDAEHVEFLKKSNIVTVISLAPQSRVSRLSGMKNRRSPRGGR